MGLFDLFKGKKIDEYVAEANEAGATVIDVREPGEFKQGHIPGAVNIPLGGIVAGVSAAYDKDAVLYLYCRSGARSNKACGQLQAAGFTNIVNMGGIGSYQGPIER